VVFALVQALRQRGMDIVRVQDRGREQADDVDVLDEALADERVMLTNDTDFLVFAAERGHDRNDSPRFSSGCSSAERLASWSKASFAKRAGMIMTQPVHKCSFCDLWSSRVFEPHRSDCR
jgi:hypothetical protein